MERMIGQNHGRKRSESEDNELKNQILGGNYLQRAKKLGLVNLMSFLLFSQKEKHKMRWLVQGIIYWNQNNIFNE